MSLLEIFQCCFDHSGSVLSLKQEGQNTSGKVRIPHFEFLEPISYKLYNIKVHCSLKTATAVENYFFQKKYSQIQPLALLSRPE